MIDHIFVRIPRTASSSIDMTLPKQFGHKTAEEWIVRFGKARWEKSFTFTMVRHPYDRFLSAYYYCEMFGDRKDPNDFLREIDLQKFNDTDDNFLMVMPQTDWICDSQGQIVVDYIGRFENLQGGWKEICRQIDIEHKLLSHLSPSERKDIPLNRHSKEVLHKFYKKDFDILQYKV